MCCLSEKDALMTQRALSRKWLSFSFGGDTGYYVALLILGATGIAFAPIFAKLATETDGLGAGGISPVAVAFWRLGLSVPLFYGISLKARRAGRVVPNYPKSKLWLLLLPGVFFAGDLAAWHWAFEYTSVANATLEANMASIFVALFGWLVLKEKLNWRFPVGMGIAVFGLVVLVLAGSTMGQSHLVGDLLGILTAFCYAGYLSSVKVLTRYFDVGRIMFVATFVGSLTLLLGLLLTYGNLGTGVLIPQNNQTWVWLVGLAVVPQVTGQALIALGMSKLPVSFSAVSLLWQPVVTALMGWLILNQPMSLPQWLAGALILTGIYLARRGAEA